MSWHCLHLLGDIQALKCCILVYLIVFHMQPRVCFVLLAIQILVFFLCMFSFHCNHTLWNQMPFVEEYFANRTNWGLGRASLCYSQDAFGNNKVITINMRKTEQTPVPGPLNIRLLSMWWQWICMLMAMYYFFPRQNLLWKTHCTSCSDSYNTNINNQEAKWCILV